ncbi:Synaptotagmin-12 [Halotydeus destructor]|nr:Synaptotagmin-12 [Halotydeus destructor]
MLIIVIIVGIVLIAVAYYLYKRRGPASPPKYTDESMTLRNVLSDAEQRELEAAREVIMSVKNRRESILSLRRSSFDEATGQFVNLRNVKLARAVSCESVASDTSDGDHPVAGLPQFRMEIPDIKSWLQNPVDFIKPKQSVDDDEMQFEYKVAQTAQDSSCPQILLSMSYLPTAERLSIAIVRLRLPLECQLTMRMVYVKAYLIDSLSAKRTCKKKTSMKQMAAPGQRFIEVPFNELMIFKLPISQLHTASIRLSSSAIGFYDGPNDSGGHASTCRIGSVVVGCDAPTSSGMSHWTAMMTSMRKPSTMWHVFQLNEPKNVENVSA